MKSENLIFLIFMAGIFLLSACSLDVEDDTKYVTGEGPVVSKYIETDPFKNIIHAGFGSMNIQIDDTFSIELRAQQNIMDEMTFLTDDDYFFWGLAQNVQIIESDTILMNIKIPGPLEFCNLTGIGNIEISGPGQDRMDLEIQGLGNILAYGLQVNESDVYLAGSGNIKVNVTDTLTGLLTGNGNIYYKGEPVIQVGVMGNGSIIDEN